jgi:microcystin-dependent protein
MADIGDKAFTTEMVQEIKRAVMAELGTNAFVKRYLATVSAVNTTTSEVTVYLSGSDITSASFYARGILLPSIGDQVVACIDGADRWIEDVIRPQTATPYLTFSTASGVPTGSMVPYVGATAPTGWLLCDGTPVSRTTYADLFAVIGTKAGIGDGSTTFALPDMKDRFLGGNLLTATQYAQNAGAVTPNAAFSAPAHTHTQGGHGHTFTGSSHSHDIAHDHADNFSANAATESTHTHSVDPGNTSSAGPSAASSRFYATSGTSVTTAAGDHFHNTNIASFTSGAGSVHDHGITVSGGVTALPATSVTATATGAIDSITASASGAASATAIGTPKAGLVNFIIKT